MKFASANFYLNLSPSAKSFRLLTNLFMEKQYVKLHNNGQATVFAISNRGAGGEAPCKKNVVILRSARRRMRRRISC